VVVSIIFNAQCALRYTSAVFAVLIFSCFPVSAEDSVPVPVPVPQQTQSLLFSHVEHPDSDVPVNMLKRAYASIGIEVTFSSSTNGRDALLLLKNGMIDGDIARLHSFAQRSDDLIAIEPSIMEGQLFLVCAKGVECNRQLVERNDILMLTNMPFNKIFRENNINVMTGSYGTFTKNIEYLKLHRADYLLYGGTMNDISRIDTEFTVIPILSFPLYHILHKRYSHLVPELEKALHKQVGMANADGMLATHF
jgi:hypothetical protein